MDKTLSEQLGLAELMIEGEPLTPRQRMRVELYDEMDETEEAQMEDHWILKYDESLTVIRDLATNHLYFLNTLYPDRFTGTKKRLQIHISELQQEIDNG